MSAIFLWPDHLFEKYPEAFGVLQKLAPEWLWGILGITFSVVKLLSARYGWARIAVLCTAMAAYAWGVIGLATLIAGHIVLLTGFSISMAAINLSSLKELVRTIHAARSDTPLEQRGQQSPGPGGCSERSESHTPSNRQERRSLLPR